MERNVINSKEAPAAAGGYSQALEIVDAKRLLFISGQIPENLDGSIPQTFEEQAKLAWNNVEAIKASLDDVRQPCESDYHYS